MAEVQRPEQAAAIESVSSGVMDVDHRSFLIGTAKIRALEKRLEEYFLDVEDRLAAIQLLQKLKSKVIKGGESFDANKDAEFLQLLEKAQALGLSWTDAGWKNADERDALLDALHVSITGKESENQTVFMRINRLMNLRSEAANLFTKLVSDTHNQKVRVLGRIERK